MTRIFRVLLAFHALLAGAVFAQPSSGPNFSLTIRAESRQVSPGQDIFITIDITNLSDHSAVCSIAPVTGSLDMAFQYDVRTSDGRPVQRIARTGPATGDQFRLWPCLLNAKSQGFTVSGATIRAQDFDIASPGRYQIQIAQYDPLAGQTVLSNRIEVTVEPGARSDIPREQPKPGLYLTIPEALGVLSDDDLDVGIMWDNTDHQIFDCTPRWGITPIDEAFVYDVRTSDGRPVRRLAANRTPPSSSAELNKPCNLGPREVLSYTRLGALMKAFDMGRPGVYTVQVSRPDPVHPGQTLAVSNVLTVTVKQAPQYPPLEFILSPEKVEVAQDGDFNLSVKWVNHSGLTLSCFRSDFNSPVDEAFVYDVRDSTGKPVTRLPAEVARSTVGVSPNISVSDCAIGPGRNTIETSLGSVMRAFDMRRPGTYTVRVWREANVWKTDSSLGSDVVMGVSNTVTVTVKQPK